MFQKMSAGLLFSIEKFSSVFCKKFSNKDVKHLNEILAVVVF